MQYYIVFKLNKCYFLICLIDTIYIKTALEILALYGFVWVQLNNEFISLSFTLKSHDSL